MKNSGWHCLGP